MRYLTSLSFALLFSVACGSQQSTTEIGYSQRMALPMVTLFPEHDIDTELDLPDGRVLRIFKVREQEGVPHPLSGKLVRQYDLSLYIGRKKQTTAPTELRVEVLEDSVVYVPEYGMVTHTSLTDPPTLIFSLWQEIFKNPTGS